MYIMTYELLQSVHVASTYTLHGLSNYSGQYKYMYANIKEYGSYFLNGVLYLRYGSSSRQQSDAKLIL